MTFRLLLALALLGLNLLFCNGAQASRETDYAKIGWWQISYREVDALAGCEASARFNDQTEVIVALLRDRNTTSWLIWISNPQWASWIERKKRHEITLVPIDPTVSWRDAWYASDDNKLYLPARKELINSVADAKALAILDGSQRLLARLDMKDSENAIKSVVNCMQDHASPATAQAQSKTQVSSSSGTAFFVTPNFLLTNDHVVKDCGADIRVRYPNQDWHKATVSSRDETNDLALLHTDLESLEIATFRLRSQIGEPVAAYGFPYAGLLSSGGNFTTGTVAALAGMNDDSRFLQTSAPVQPGNSGGPLLDMSGSVIGIVEGQLNALTMMRFVESLPQNVNFAIQAPIAVNFLAVKGQTPKTDSSVTRADLSSTEVAERAQKFTVQVHCGEAPAQTSDASTVKQQSPPPVPSHETLEAQAKQLALSIQRLWSGPNSDALAAMDELYQGDVNYYGKQMTRAEIMKEKRALARSAPTFCSRHDRSTSGRTAIRLDPFRQIAGAVLLCLSLPCGHVSRNAPNLRDFISSSAIDRHAFFTSASVSNATPQAVQWTGSLSSSGVVIR
ncbi:Trypsin-like peptidase domain-containing protein [Bradyrhizobium sp. Rc2d]|uniref:S1C family serine protease n=1 Tax=Bradyrhizobium sp. Rc2d TaxID=1855321 RepID=UPI00087EF7B6|nr:serine protease [Bradyrhizobium sp. Rc2d]SDJ47312.1 Trypsin-like peptidase domain-containing protein [Bradyrhizobium sp. Rc2d]